MDGETKNGGLSHASSLSASSRVQCRSIARLYCLSPFSDEDYKARPYTLGKKAIWQLLPPHGAIRLLTFRSAIAAVFILHEPIGQLSP